MASVKKVFKSSIKDTSFVLPNGKFCHFKNGEYLTNNDYEISVLNHEISMQHPIFYIDESEVEREEKSAEEVLKDLKAAAIAEFLADNPHLTPADAPAITQDATPAAPAPATALTLGGIQTSQDSQNAVESNGAKIGIPNLKAPT